ncbi:MAG TPA: hypothetical protein VNV66_11510 [Pilimelia sp.]|nr:hypothetical protein [Pilimelia sp.]
MASGDRPQVFVPGQLRRSPLRFDAGRYAAVKDPCPVPVGDRWHLFGTAVHDGYRYEILHATAARPEGPWRLCPPARLPDVPGSCVAAPGVVAEGQLLHMFVQTEYNLLGGVVEHLVSDDHGDTFRRVGTALTSLPDTPEAGVYDPHPAQIGGQRYLTYSAFAQPGRPDIHLARSLTGSWEGPWQRLGRILGHADVPGHNQHDDPAYEWGLEGAQLVELPDGRVLLNAVCFRAGAAPGDRQRVFFALADTPTGPYQVVGPVLDPAGPGEIGHAAAVVHDGALSLFFQERVGGGPWGYGLAAAPLPPAQPTGQTRTDTPADRTMP